MFRSQRAGCLFGIVTSLYLWLRASMALAAPDPESDARRTEASLLSRRLDLSALRSWSPQKQKWTALPSPHAQMIVLHLWAIECKPCVAELPVLRSFLEGWRDHAQAQFLLVAETENEDRLLEFWNTHMIGGSSRIPLNQVGDERIRTLLETGRQPLTLILDEQWVVRQAFVGSISARTTELTAGMMRLLESLREPITKSVRQVLRRRTSE